MKTIKHGMRLAALLLASLLGACGGGGDDADESLGAVRLVNATQDYGAIDLYTSDTRRLSAVEGSFASNYVELDEGTYVFKLHPTGSTGIAATHSMSIVPDVTYTLLATNRGSTLSTALLLDTAAAPSSGYAALRIYNLANAAGPVDVYVTETNADLAASTASYSVGVSSVSAITQILKGSYRIRVTGAGDKNDLRLDIPSVALADQQVATLVLSETAGGVLVNGMLVNQKGSVTAYRNQQARVRIVAAVKGNASVAAATSDGVLATTLQAPGVGGYTTVSAALPGMALTVNGVAIDTTGLAVNAGADVTLLVYGEAAAARWRLLVDDNVPASLGSHARLRLVHALNDLDSTVSLSADYVATADNIDFASASTAVSLAAGSGMRLEATTPVRTTPLYLATDVTLAAQKVYSLFVMGEASAPVTVLRKDR